MPSYIKIAYIKGAIADTNGEQNNSFLNHIFRDSALTCISNTLILILRADA
jgi:hypothetical protein